MQVHRIAILLFVFAALPLFAQEERALSVRQAQFASHARQNWLIAVGVNRFQDQSVSPLSYCANDARALCDFFTANGLVDSAQAYLLITDAAQENRRPLRNNILYAVQYAANNATPDSTIILHFSGHGFIDAKGASYLFPQDGKLELLRDTAVPVARINEMLAESKARRKILFIDACRNQPERGGRGGAANVSRQFLEALKAGAGQITLASCGAGQVSYEMPETRHGLFTWHLLHGLQGAAEADRNGLITLNGLQAYLAGEVPAWCRRNLREVQQPWMWGEMSVPIPLAVKPEQPPAVSGAPQAPILAATPQPQVAMAPGGGSNLESLIRSRERQEQLLNEAKETFAKLEKYFSQAGSKEEAQTAAQAWQGYLDQYQAAGYRLDEARRFLESFLNWTVTKDYSIDLGSGVQLELVWIPGGTFMMGSPASEEGRYDDEGPVHQVELDGFWLGKYEVTQAQYQAIIGSNPAHFRGANKPVEQVSWNDAMEFCRRLSQKTGKTYTLPTEAQWEYACRAGTTTPFYFGATISTEQANYNGNFTYGNGRKGVYRAQTTAVGSFPPNAFGLYDMHGNVWEWCNDWYGPYSAANQFNPTGPDNGEYRVLRGGSWFDNPGFCRAATRDRYNPGTRNILIGLRVCVVSRTN